MLSQSLESGILCPQAPSQQARVAEDLLSSVLVSWQAACEAVLAEVGKISLPVCWCMRSSLLLAEAALSASLWNAGADGCVGGRRPGVSTEQEALPAPRNHHICRGQGRCTLGLSCARRELGRRSVSVYEYKALSASMQQVSAHFWTPCPSCALRGDLSRAWVTGDGLSCPKEASSEQSSLEGGRGSHGCLDHHQGGLEQFLSRLCAPEDLAFFLGMFLSPACLCQPTSLSAPALLSDPEGHV